MLSWTNYLHYNVFIHLFKKKIVFKNNYYFKDIRGFVNMQFTLLGIRRDDDPICHLSSLSFFVCFRNYISER